MKQAPQLTHVRISDRVLQIGDSVGNACTLLLGDEKALLFDAMTGSCDLKEYVESLTDLPLTVVISHGHFDHVCGAWQFGSAFMNALESATYTECRRILKDIERNTGIPLPEKLMSGAFRLDFQDVQEGDVFDLGGRRAEAVLLPGHTPGSIGLLVREEKLLLTGDAVSPQMCLFLPESLPVRVLFRTLDKVERLPAERILGSHFMKTFPMTHISVFRKCAESIGKVRGYPYVFPPVPEYKGTVWFYDMHDDVIHQPVCVITPPQL